MFRILLQPSHDVGKIFICPKVSRDVWLALAVLLSWRCALIFVHPSEPRCSFLLGDLHVIFNCRETFNLYFMCCSSSFTIACSVKMPILSMPSLLFPAGHARHCFLSIA